MMDTKINKCREKQSIGFLKPAEAGMPIKEIGRKHSFRDASVYERRSKYGGTDAIEANRM